MVQSGWWTCTGSSSSIRAGSARTGWRRSTSARGPTRAGSTGSSPRVGHCERCRGSTRLRPETSPPLWTAPTERSAITFSVCSSTALDLGAAPILESLARTSTRPEVRVQAICTLQGLGVLEPSLLLHALRDAHPGVRRQAVRLSEPWLGKDVALGRAVIALAGRS